MIVEDRPRDAGSADDLFEPRRHGVLRRTHHRHQSDRLHVLMAQGPAPREVAKPNAQDNQTFALPDLNGVIDDPDPVVGDLLWAEKGRRPDPLHPLPAG